MAKIDSTVSVSAAAGAQNRPAEDEIRHQLQSVLASPSFHGSKRCQKFLEYVCEKSLAGETQALKERVIATEVYGRAPASDLGEDTIVRVGAREVRKRLAQYYVSSEGAASQVRIELPPGAYAPEFRLGRPESVDGAGERAPARKRGGWRLAAGITVAAVVIAAGAASHWMVGKNPNERAFDEFWQPVMQTQGPLLVAVAHPLVYHPSLRAMKLNEQRHPDWPVSEQKPIEVNPKGLDGSDMVPVFNQYVGFGDLVAASDVAVLLAKRDKPVRVRMASEIEFADLRQTPTLLIGAITNRWSMEMEKPWRFQFARNADFLNMIVDTYQAEPNRREWTIPAKQDGSSPEDYMLLCRVHSPLTGAPLLLAAGLKQFGTEAAGALLSDPERFGAILRRLPSGWETKDLQLVLHSRVIGNSATQPELVAWHVWAPSNPVSSKK